MSSNTKKLIIFSAILILLSALFSGLVRSTVRFAFGGFGSVKQVTKSYNINGNIEEISIETDKCNISVLPAKDGKAQVVRTGSSGNRFSLKTAGKKVMISEKDSRFRLFGLGSYSGKSEITVYLPEQTYKSLKIKSSTGTTNVRTGSGFEEIEIKTNTGTIDLAAVTVSDDLEVQTTTGKVTLANIRTEDLSVKSNTGSIHLKNVIAAEEMEIKNDTGSVDLEKCDGMKINIKTDTGRITGTLLSGKTFDARSGLGHVSVPVSTPGGLCTLRSDTGSITIGIEN